MAPSSPATARETPRDAESVLKTLGYARIPPVQRDPPAEPEFWVQEAGVPRRTFPVFVARSSEPKGLDRVDAWFKGSGQRATPTRRAIVVVPSDGAAEEAWSRVRQLDPNELDPELSILVVPPKVGAGGAPHWHSVVVSPKELLRVATGVVVGLFRRASEPDGGARIDFDEMLEILKTRFRIDVAKSLGVESDEDVMFILYQLAMRDSYAPGDPGANLHLLVLKPTGPAARLPWFAA